MQPGRLPTNDAVILIPGIMGSELIEADSGRVLWGLASRDGTHRCGAQIRRQPPWTCCGSPLRNGRGVTGEFVRRG